MHFMATAESKQQKRIWINSISVMTCRLCSERERLYEIARSRNDPHCRCRIGYGSSDICSLEKSQRPSKDIHLLLLRILQVKRNYQLYCATLCISWWKIQLTMQYRHVRAHRNVTENARNSDTGIVPDLTWHTSYWLIFSTIPIVQCHIKSIVHLRTWQQSESFGFFYGSVAVIITVISGISLLFWNSMKLLTSTSQ